MTKAYLSRNVFVAGGFRQACLLIDDGKILDLLDRPPDGFAGPVQDYGDLCVIPGLVDTHVHINEPGRTDWEGFTTATQAAAAGGITTVIDMPLNCIPVTTSKAALKEKLQVVAGQLWSDVGFWGGVTADNAAQLPELLDSGILGVKSFLIDSGIPEFSSVDFDQVAAAMKEVAKRDIPYLFHAEWEGAQAVAERPIQGYHDFVLSRPAAWEDGAIAKLVELAKVHQCKTHIVHLSSASALTTIRQAKAAGIPITAETCPHYLLFDAEKLAGQVDPKKLPLYKCCPPIRGRDNQHRLWQGLCDGTIDFVVSDHSPCTAGLKLLETGDLDRAWGGVSGLQFGFGAMAEVCEQRGLPLAQLIEKMTIYPAKWAGLAGQKGSLEPGKDADFMVWDPGGTTDAAPAATLYRHKQHAYNDMTIRGRVVHTILRGNPTIEDGAPVTSPPGMALMRTA